MAGFQVDEVVTALHQARRDWRDSQQRTQEGGERELPSREVVAQVVESLTGALFPMRLGPTDLRHRDPHPIAAAARGEQHPPDPEHDTGLPDESDRFELVF